MFRPTGDRLHAGSDQVAQDVVRCVLLIGPDVSQDLRQHDWFVLALSEGRSYAAHVSGVRRPRSATHSRRHAGAVMRARAPESVIAG